MSSPDVGRPSASLHFAVGEINGKLDQLVASLLPRFASLEAADQDLLQRVTALEVWQGRLIGGASLVVFVVGSWEVWSHVTTR